MNPGPATHDGWPLRVSRPYGRRITHIHHKHTHTHIVTHTHTQSHVHTQSHTHTHSHTYTHIVTQPYACTCTHTERGKDVKEKRDGREGTD